MQDGCGLLTIEDQVAFYKAHGIATGLNFHYNNIEIYLSPAQRQLGFYRTQVSLVSGLWVPVSVSNSVQDLFEALLM